ncbi:MAG TPA: hypothetical protein VFW86_05785 [Candidatus Limnocylindrales bacterium]|nr:hypothetical protein [Candidatus Limnocylindrales bacterium]
MKLFADFHHHALWQSLRLTFEDRFGWQLYRPIGMTWFERYAWNFERHLGDAVAHQYLDFWPGDRDCGDHWERDDRQNPGRVHRMVTFEQAHDLRPDVVMATLEHNERAFAHLAGEWGARYAIQIGNQWGDVDWRDVDFALISAKPIAVPAGIPHLVYHQEFDLDTFRYVPPAGFGPVRSFVQCFPETPEYPRFRQLAEAARDLDWQVYGAYGRAPLDEWAAGNIEATPAVADAMRDAGLIYHAKYWSDGYGHVIHNAFAVGRPVLGSARYYAGKLAEPLWVEGETSFDLDRRTRGETIDLIRDLRADPDRYLRMCEAAAARFREVVDFDAEADQIAELAGAAVPA